MPKQTWPNPKPTTFPNKPKTSAGIDYAGKHGRAYGHVNPGNAMAKQLAGKNKGS